MKPKNRMVLGFAAASALFVGAAPAAAKGSALTFVNPLIGTDPNPITRQTYAMDTGNVFPGAVLPRGMIAWSPDTTHGKVIAGGYWYPDSKIEGFSLTHFSGRGIPCLKDFPMLPITAEITESPGRSWEKYAEAFSHSDEQASPGYYSVRLRNGVKAEFTVALRAGLARFQFPETGPARLLIRSDGNIEVSKNEIVGWRSAHLGFDRARYSIYFVAQADAPIRTTMTWSGERFTPSTAANGPSCGAILTFASTGGGPVQVRVGISYVSVENARENLRREIPAWDFGAVRTGAETAWSKVLDRVEIEGGTKGQTTAFYTALYHCFIHPNVLDDANGQYVGMDNRSHTVEPGHHQYQNIPCWDQYRSLVPLIAMLQPEETSDIVQSLVNYAGQDQGMRATGGGLPRWEQVNRNTGGMIGDGPDAVISGAYAFGATHFDTQSAFAAMDKGASMPGTTSDGHLVRNRLEDYMELGFVASNEQVNEPVSLTLEYCVQDFAIARFARALGKTAKYVYYNNRAQNWKHLFNPATGYLQIREGDDTFDSWWTPDTTHGYLEGSAAQYVWLVNFNLGGLIDRMGGGQKAAARLDTFFEHLNGPRDSVYAYMGNEPSEEAPWIYDFAKAPWGTQKVVSRIRDELFTGAPNGLPGNDDAGSLSSWYVFAALGLYPEIPGVAGFAIGSPQFAKAVVHLGPGRDLTILGRNSAPDAPYVQALTIDGKNHDGCWIDWARLRDGGLLDFALGTRRSRWGLNPEWAPPSFDSIADVPAK